MVRGEVRSEVRGTYEVRCKVVAGSILAECSFFFDLKIFLVVAWWYKPYQFLFS